MSAIYLLVAARGHASSTRRETLLFRFFVDACAFFPLIVSPFSQFTPSTLGATVAFVALQTALLRQSAPWCRTRGELYKRRAARAQQRIHIDNNGDALMMPTAWQCSVLFLCASSKSTRILCCRSESRRAFWPRQLDATRSC